MRIFLVYSWSPSTKIKVPQGQRFCLFRSLLYPKQLQQYPVPSRYFTNVCRMNDWLNDRMNEWVNERTKTEHITQPAPSSVGKKQAQEETWLLQGYTGTPPAVALELRPDIPQPCTLPMHQCHKHVTKTLTPKTQFITSPRIISILLVKISLPKVCLSKVDLGSPEAGGWRRRFGGGEPWWKPPNHTSNYAASWAGSP